MLIRESGLRKTGRALNTRREGRPHGRAAEGTRRDVPTGCCSPRSSSRSVVRRTVGGRRDAELKPTIRRTEQRYQRKNDRTITKKKETVNPAIPFLCTSCACTWTWCKHWQGPHVSFSFLGWGVADFATLASFFIFARSNTYTCTYPGRGPLTFGGPGRPPRSPPLRTGPDN